MSESIPPSHASVDPARDNSIEAPPFETPGVTAAINAEHQDVKDKAVSGAKAMASRTAIQFLLRVGGSLIMSRLLFAADYGAFGIAAWVASIGGYFSDVGLGSALLRQPHPPSEDELFTVFVSQQVMTLTMVAMVVLFGPWLGSVAQLPRGSQTLVYVTSVGLLVVSLRIIPLMVLERDLRFKAVARIEVLQDFVATGATITLAWLGWGPWALACGLLLAAATMTAGTWVVSPWRPRGRFRVAIFKRLARFGLPFQLNAVFPILLSGWVPVLIGKFLGVSAVGLVNWATGLSSVPMMLAQVLNRVAFPAYARVQNDPEIFARYLRGALRRLAAMLSLLVPIGVLACPAAIPFLFNSRWTPAVQLVQWFSFDVLLATLLGTITAAQNASGRATERLWVAIAAGVADWVFGWIVICHFGLASVGPTVVSTTLIEFLVTCYLMQRRLPQLRGLLSESLWVLGRLGLIMGVTLLLSQHISNAGPILRCSATITIFLVTYAATELAMGVNGSLPELRAILTMVRTRR